jgi:hypothetical protein
VAGTNAFGVVAGKYYGYLNMFIRDVRGRFTSFNGPATGQDPMPYSINEQGAIAGAIFDTNTLQIHGFVLQ